jgi:competence protein ComEC
MSAVIPPEKSPNFSHHPLLWLAAAFALGICAAKYLVLDWQLSLAAVLFSVGLTLVFQKRELTPVVLLLTAFFFVGAFVFQLENQIAAPNRLKNLYDENHITSGEPVEIEGVLRGKPELAANGFFLELNAEKIIYKQNEQNVSGLIKLFASAETEEAAAQYAQMNLEYGSRLRVACLLRREENYQNPGGISRLQILGEQGIDAAATIKSPLLVEPLGGEAVFEPLAWIYQQRQNLIVEFRARFSISTAGILIASLLGNKYFLDKTTAELFREGGTFHVLVISGLHITFIGGLMLLFVRLFSRSRWWQFLIAATFLWAYALAVGADVPVVRAALMFTILLFSRVVYRTGTLLNSLGACALTLLVWRPGDLFGASFQLTFASVAAIVATALPLIENLRRIGAWTPTAETPFPPRVPVWLRRFCETFYWRERAWKFESGRQVWSARLFKSPHLKWLEACNVQEIARYLLEGALVSLAAQIWLLPFSIAYFHRVVPVSILLNLWVGFFIALESFAAVFAVFLAQLSDSLAYPFIILTEVFNAALLFAPSLFVENDWASFRVPHYAGDLKIIYFVYFAPLLVLTAALSWWKPFALRPRFNARKTNLLVGFAALSLTGFVFLVVYHPLSAPHADGRLHVDFLDVGQGDAALVTFPGGETVLIDGGGQINYVASGENSGGSEIFEPDAPTVGETVVSAFLWEKGYSQIDYILATHADADHLQGLSDVAKNFRVGAAFFGRTPENNQNYAALEKVLQKNNVRIVKLKSGDVLEFGAAKMEILYPLADEASDAVSDNNHSLVARLTFGSKKILLTGDIEKEAESELVRLPAFLQADVVKVAHHGSRTSSSASFIGATGAEYAIISVGKRSRFGHPHEEVVERWETSGAKVLTTGAGGTISISTDGKDFELQTFAR